MPIPKSVATFNRTVTNRITGPFANRLPGFGVVVHVGRKSGKHYRTPVNAFARPDGFVVALTYGADSDWVKNVLAAGGCEIESRGHVHRLTAPVVIHDEQQQEVPGAVRPILRALGVDDFLRLSS